MIFRRERDSNPWYDYSHVSLAMKYFRPLSHLSIFKKKEDSPHGRENPLPKVENLVDRHRDLSFVLFTHPRPLGLEPRTSGFGDLRSTN
jgi:hypothetical protein